MAAQNEKVGTVQQVLGERITGVQQDLREVKADLPRATHDDVAALRASVAAIAAKLGASGEQPRKPEGPAGQ